MPLQTTPNPSGAIQEIVIAESTTTFSPLFDCKALVYVVGAGGAGGSVTGSSSGGPNHAASGGGAGGLAISELTLSASTNYTATIGEGGAGVAESGACRGGRGGRAQTRGVA